MEDQQAYAGRMEHWLAGLLRHGAIAASFCLALGLVLSRVGFHHLLALGVVMMISLPVIRVAMMALIFLKSKDYRFAAISAAVLFIIVFGFLWGVLHTGAHIDL